MTVLTRRGDWCFSRTRLSALSAPGSAYIRRCIPPGPAAPGPPGPAAEGNREDPRTRREAGRPDRAPSEAAPRAPAQPGPNTER